jgi:hypothetical protein
MFDTVCQTSRTKVRIRGQSWPEMTGRKSNAENALDMQRQASEVVRIESKSNPVLSAWPPMAVRKAFCINALRNATFLDTLDCVKTVTNDPLFP